MDPNKVISDFLSQFNDQQSLEKQAQAQGANTFEKLAEDLTAAGRHMADAFVDQLLSKVAEMIPAAGRGLGAPEGAVHEVARRLGLLHGEQTQVGDDTSIRAEELGAVRGRDIMHNPPTPLPKGGM